MSDPGDSDSSVNSKSAEPFGSDSGSEYLPTSNRQIRKRNYFNKYKRVSENSATATSASEDDNTEIVAVCDSGSKKKKQKDSPMQDSGTTSGNTDRKKFCDFFEIKVDTSTNRKNKNDKLAKYMPCFQKRNKIVYLKMKNSGTSGLKRHLKAKHGSLFDKEFSQEETNQSKVQCSALNGSGSTSILEWINRSQRQSEENVS